MKAIQRKDGHRSRRYLFRNWTSLSEVRSIARASAWDEVGVTPDVPGDSAEDLVAVWELLPGLRATYTRESALSAAHVVITSKVAPEEIDSAVALFEAHPGVLTFEDLIQQATSTRDPESEAEAVARAGLGAPLVADARFTDTIQNASASPHTRVREGALWAMAYTEWIDFSGTLEQIARSDPDEFLRDFATRVLRVFEHLGLEST